jgi:GGDEF domain-containing protein
MESVADEDVVALVMLQLEQLGRLNEETSHLAGDRLIQAAARAAERGAARVAGSAFRISGRRLAVVVCCAPERVRDVVRDIELEFLSGPSVRTSVAVAASGDRVEDLVASARTALQGA